MIENQYYSVIANGITGTDTMRFKAIFLSAIAVSVCGCASTAKHNASARTVSNAPIIRATPIQHTVHVEGPDLTPNVYGLVKNVFAIASNAATLVDTADRAASPRYRLYYIDEGERKPQKDVTNCVTAYVEVKGEQIAHLRRGSLVNILMTVPPQLAAVVDANGSSKQVAADHVCFSEFAASEP